MSLRSAHSHGLSVEDVVDLLGDDKYARKAVNLLIKYSDLGKIPANELDEELVLLFDHFRLAIPVGSIYGSLSWSMRLVSIQDLEIPYVVRFFFKSLSKGLANWYDVIRMYFESIGEQRTEDFPKIFFEMVKKGLIIRGEEIVEICKNYSRDGGVVIAEMKGAGLISPTVGCGRFSKSPLYEINRFFALLVKKS